MHSYMKNIGFFVALFLVLSVMKDLTIKKGIREVVVKLEGFIMTVTKKELESKLQNLMNIVDEMEVRWNFRHADMQIDNKWQVNHVTLKEDIS